MTNIDRVAMELCKLGVTLEQEDDAAGFLGVKFYRESETGMLEMKQTSLNLTRHYLCRQLLCYVYVLPQTLSLISSQAHREIPQEYCFLWDDC